MKELSKQECCKYGHSLRENSFLNTYGYRECRVCIKIRIKKRKEAKPWLKNYANAKRRCLDKNFKSYKYYGGKGITCLLKKPSVDRFDNNGNYELSNCRFIELTENISGYGENHYRAKLTENKVRRIRELVILGIKQIDLAKELKVAESTIWRVVHHKRWKHVN